MKSQSLILFFLCALLFTACTSPKPVSWIEQELPEGWLELSYEEAFGFGPHRIHVSFHDLGRTAYWDLGSVDLSNDGANLGDHNFTLLPHGEREQAFVLSGQEQDPETLRVVFVPGAAPALLKGAR